MTSRGGMIVFYFIFIVVDYLVSIYMKRDVMQQSLEKRCSGLSVILLTGAIIGIGFPTSKLISRVIMFYTIHSISLVPMVFANFKFKNNIKILKGLTYLIMIIPLLYLLSINNSGIVPYSIWNREILIDCLIK